MFYYNVEKTEGCLKQLRKRNGWESAIKIKNGIFQPDGQRQCEKNAMILQGIVAFFDFTNSLVFFFYFLMFFFNLPFMTTRGQQIFRCLSPTDF